MPRSADDIYDKAIEILDKALDGDVKQMENGATIPANIAIQLLQPLMTTIFFQRYQTGWTNTIYDKDEEK